MLSLIYELLRVLCVEQLLRGFRVDFFPGWDCHGLPIEQKALEQIKTEQRAALTPMDIRQTAKKFADEAIENQRSEFKRWGIMGDWGNAYFTFDPKFEVNHSIALQFLILQRFRFFNPFIGC